MIVCRNVFIYFSDHSIRRTLGVFARAMPAPAYLCVGRLRIAAAPDVEFDLQEIGGAFVYVKDATADGTSGDASPGSKQRHEWTVLRVLVVDDSAYIRKVVKEMLSRSPFLEVVGTARDGEEALELVERLQPDVVTCDLIMPGTDGVDFIRQQMAIRPVPIVVVSIAGESSERVLERPRRRGRWTSCRSRPRSPPRRCSTLPTSWSPRSRRRRPRRCGTARRSRAERSPSPATRRFRTGIVCWSSASRPAGRRA